MNDPFLIDECLSLDLVALAHARGHYATHITFRDLQGTEDPDLLPIIHAENFVLAINNARDFVRLYRGEAVHPGLIILVPGSVGGRSQARLFGLALDRIESLSDLTNKVVEATADGTVQVRDWPP